MELVMECMYANARAAADRGRDMTDGLFLVIMPPQLE